MKKKIFIILGILVALLAAWLVLFPGKNPLTASKAKAPAPEPGPAKSTPQAVAPTNGSFTPVPPTDGQPAGFPISPDSHVYRADIAEIQKNMNDFHGSALVVDGYFGPKTLAALKAYGYAATGVLNFAEYNEILMLKD